MSAVHGSATTGKTFITNVELIDPVRRPGSRSIVRETCTPTALRPGRFIEAQLATSKRDHAVVIPEDAVQPLRTATSFGRREW